MPIKLFKFYLKHKLVVKRAKTFVHSRYSYLTMKTVIARTTDEIVASVAKKLWHDSQFQRLKVVS